MRLRLVALAAVVLLAACGYIPVRQSPGRAECGPPPAPGIVPIGLGSLGYYEPGGYVLLANSQTAIAQIFGSNTWKWGCGAWTHLGQEAEAPVGFLVYEPHLRMVVGFHGAKLKGWNGKAWSDVADGPPKMAGLTYLAFDQERDQLVALTSVSDAARTWTYNDGRWTKVASSGPRGYFGSAFAYDARSKTTILFGAECFDSGFCANARDTWIWDGGSWKQMHPTPSPPPGHAEMAFDAATNQMILLASDHSTWTWENASWRDLHTTGPNFTGSSSLVYDKAGRRLVLWASNQAWTYAAGSWSVLWTVPLPPASTARTNPPPIDQTPVVSGARTMSPWTGPPCRIPYADISEASGGFVSLPGGERYADPTSVVALPEGTPGRVGQNPGLTYLPDIRKWVPVPGRWVSSDHTLYAYQAANGQIRAVKIADGSSIDITRDGGWMLIGPGDKGVYIAKPGVSGAWFVPYGGLPRQIADDGRWDAYSGGFLWGWDSSDHLLRLNVSIGSEVKWGARQYGWVAGFDREVQPFIIAMGSMWLAHSDGSFTLIWKGNNDSSAGAPALTDARGTWFAVGGGLVGRPGHGFYLYESGGGVKYLVGLDAILAGGCS